MTTELHSVDQILSMPANGDFLTDLLDQHRDLILAMHNHQLTFGGKATGSFSIKVNYSLDRHLTLKMEASAKFEGPKEPAASATVWTTSEGLLTPENPQQMRMDLRDATAPAQPIRTA